MCLIIKKDQSPLVAEEDIVCYKVICLKDGELFTTFQGCYVEIGLTYYSKLLTSRYIQLAITEGLHSFKSLDEANIIKNAFLDRFTIYIPLVVKCIIPKGSIYYEGIFKYYFRNNESYASDTLTYVEILK